MMPAVETPEWNYFVTAQRPTVVTHAVGPLCFTSATSADLIVARSTRLEVHRYDSSQRILKPLRSIQVQGKVEILQAVKWPGSTRECVILCTAKRQFVVLHYDEVRRTIASVGKADCADPVSRPVDHHMMCACDPEGRLAVIYSYEGVLKVVLMNELIGKRAEGKEPCCELTVLSLRMAEPQVLDIAFLQSSLMQQVGEAANLAVLHVDGQGRHYVSVWAVDAETEELCPTTGGASSQLKHSASKLEAVQMPVGGCLALGGASAALVSSNSSRWASTLGGPRLVTAVAPVDGVSQRWVVGGSDGSLWLLTVEATTVGDSLNYESIGCAAPARALLSLPEGRLFVGSSLGDSCVLNVHRDSQKEGRKLSVQETWTQLGPIVDFCIADPDDQGQGKVVTCSGMGRTGSLRVVRIGIGVNEIAVVDDIGAVLGMWALGGEGDQRYKPLLVLTYVQSTRFLAFAPDSTGAMELADCVVSGFAVDEDSLLVCESSGFLVQTTRTAVNLASRDALTSICQWVPPPNSSIQVAAVINGIGGVVDGVMVGLNTRELVCLKIQKTDSSVGLMAAARWQLGGEPSCLYVHHGFLAVGFWTCQLKLFKLDDDAAQQPPFSVESLPSNTIPRSVAIVRFSGHIHALVGLADGRVVSYRVNEETGALMQRKVMHLGVQSCQLVPFRSSEDQECVFATGDRPTVVHSQSHAQVDDEVAHLAYSIVNLRQVGFVATFGKQGPLADHLAFVSERRLWFGSLEDIQRVHVRTIPLGQSPNRVCYHKQANVFAVGCHPIALDNEEENEMPQDGDVDMGLEDTAGVVRIMHGKSFDTVQTVRMEDHESISSMCSAYFGAQECIVFGTGLSLPEESEPSHGRVLIYAPSNRSQSSSSQCACTSFEKIHDMDVGGAVYSLIPFNGMLLGSVNNCVYIWKWNASTCKLEVVCSHGACIIALFLQTKGELILVGDLMKSACLLRYNPATLALEEVAQDSETAWLTATAMPAKTMCFCADDMHNLFALSPKRGPLDGHRLERVGQMHVGEFVNRMHVGSLVSQPAELIRPDVPMESLPAVASAQNLLAQVVWASVDGAVGLIATFRGQQAFSRLCLMQDAIANEAQVLEGLAHSDWRNCWHDARGSSPHKGFIDGDLIESFLDLPRASQQAVVDRLHKMGVVVDGSEALIREVHELAQLH